jgi:DNA-directed RNA polymerase specialized sigma24 family protein
MAVSMNRGASSKDVESSTLDGDSSTSYLSSIPDRVGDLDQVLRNQFKSAFEDVLSTMTEKRRTALTMLSQGYEAPEIAKTMGIKTNAVYKLIFDARKNAREGLLERGIDSTFFDER